MKSDALQEEERIAGLVLRARGGDGRAFRKLMADYQQAFYGLARRHTQSHEDADDVLQDAFVKIFQHLSRLSRPGAFFPWARRIVINTALDHIRRGRRSMEIETTIADPHTVDRLEVRADSRPESPDRAVEQREFFAKLERALRTLPPRQREIITLHDIEGLNTEEIARRCRCPAATVRSNLFYAREKLREVLSVRRVTH